MRIGLLRNAVSTGNRGRPPPVLPSGTTLVEPNSPEETVAALGALKAAGTEVVVIDGGDGTVRAVLSRLDRVFDTPPPIAIIANGNTNLIARRLGAVTQRGGLARLAALTPAGADGHLRTAPVLRIDFADGRPAERGFIAGWGAYAAGTRIGTREIAARHGAQIVRAVAATLRRTLVGKEAAMLRRGVPCEFRADGHEVVEGPRFLGIATTLPGPLIAGLSPFWGEGSGALRWLDISAPPRRLALAAPLVALGRPMGWMRRAGYRSGRAGRIDLVLTGDLVMDGEAVASGAGMAATMTANECVRIVDMDG